MVSCKCLKVAKDRHTYLKVANAVRLVGASVLPVVAGGDASAQLHADARGKGARRVAEARVDAQLREVLARPRAAVAHALAHREALLEIHLFTLWWIETASAIRTCFW